MGATACLSTRVLLNAPLCKCNPTTLRETMDKIVGSVVSPIAKVLEEDRRVATIVPLFEKGSNKSLGTRDQ